MPCRLFQFIRFRLALRLSALLIAAILLPAVRIQAVGEDDVRTDTSQLSSQRSAAQSEEPDPDFSPRGSYQGPLDILHIARFDKLPMRMHLEPYLLPPSNTEKLDPRYVPLFERTLRDVDDAELLETAALSLARVAEGKMQSIESATDILLKRLKSHTNRRVRLACARALANSEAVSSAAELLALEAQTDDAERLWIDPALARWKYAPAGDVWKKRLTDESQTAVAVSLACEGLAALNDPQVSDSLRLVLNNRRLMYEKRYAAAKALCSIVPEISFEESAKFVAGNVSERILAVQLLSSQHAASQAKLLTLCADASDGVASVAWQAMFHLNPEQLLPALIYGRNHRDAIIRMTTARIMRKFPTPERAMWLHEQLSDKHLEVRNVAREMSVLVAQEVPMLRDSIVAMAGDRIAAGPEDWQGIEQSLLLLGQLRGERIL
jgi:HEAT repeat protein